MILPANHKGKWLLVLLSAVSVLCACQFSRSYRPAEQKTIGDFPASHQYRKIVGVMTLSNASIFTSSQVVVPFMNAFFSGVSSTCENAMLLLPGGEDHPSFLKRPPMKENGGIDVQALVQSARQMGINSVVSPMLMDIRVRQEESGFLFFGNDGPRLQVHTASAVYDVITGARLELAILNEDVKIDAQQAEAVGKGQEIELAKLVEVAREMGEALGRQMGDVISQSRWVASIAAIEDDSFVLAAGSDVGIEKGDLFSVLDGSQSITGFDGQRFVAPGPRIGEMIIEQVSPKKALGRSSSKEIFPVGSILVPGR